MDEQYWLETTCLDCGERVIHPMGASQPVCHKCGSRRINSRMVGGDVIERYLKRRAAPPE